MSGPSAFIFDFDGTIIDTEAVELASLQAMWSRHGRTLETDRWKSFLGLEAPDWVAALVDETHGVADPTVERESLEQDDRLRTGREPLRPGVWSIIEAALSSGVLLGIASNAARRRIDDALVQKGLADRFDVVVARDDVTMGKPDPDAYRLACSRLGVAPSACIAFEDSAPGVVSAVAAGLRCIAAPTEFTVGHDFTSADLLLEHLGQLSVPDLLDGSLRRIQSDEGGVDQ